MKKKFKIFLLAILALVVVGGGYLLYIFQFKEYEVADEEVDEIIDNPYDIVLPNGTKLVIDGEEASGDEKNQQTATADGEKTDGQQTAGVSSSTATEDKTTSSSTAGGGASTSQADGVKQPAKDSAGNTADKNSSTGNQSDKKDPAVTKPTTGNAGSAKPAKKDSVASIKQKYVPTVNNLQGQVDGKINSLISRAKNEYSTKKANGESIDYGYFYNKYMSAANSLEAQTDAVFNGVVSSLEKDLQANGYDKSYSQSIRDEYAAQKKARRDSIMSKAMGR
ncbi:hypothetical protein CSV80_15870 [Sporosarcina sp. P12(2017)]|uniref:hypothetical protein n=1 Tax=unclassified Sporosarcina TaxID=2647733 RepID=UPI000C1679A7|nr:MULTISPECIES: hypothetical protein [unclassified Sporosarcina]PIC56142.1 hypothetical protein CSV81_15875 [Sporosarcina sp. P10]PIC59470.1 hypothetical protein CSV80_15870 [Sporosarcina sp. P12(2017)]